jgi:hypothetical protein
MFHVWKNHDSRNIEYIQSREMFHTIRTQRTEQDKLHSDGLKKAMGPLIILDST